MQYSVALSDAVLAAVCLISAFAFLSSRLSLSASTGFALVGAAALLGVLRFAFFPEVRPVHSLVSTMAGQIGMPLLGLAFVLVGWRALSARQQLAVVFLLAICFVLFHFLVPFKLYGTIVGGAAMVIVIATGIKHFSSSRNFALTAIGGGALVVIAGLGLRGDGELAGMLRVNWYHYALALAMGLLYSALSKKKN